MTPDGLPHSDIHGSKRASRSPWHFAGCCVLHRLSVPRHPPCALINLPLRFFSSYRLISQLKSRLSLSIIIVSLKDLFVSLKDLFVSLKDLSLFSKSTSDVRQTSDSLYLFSFFTTSDIHIILMDNMHMLVSRWSSIVNVLPQPICLFKRAGLMTHPYDSSSSLADIPLVAVVVDPSGIEPLTSCLQSRRSPS